LTVKEYIFSYIDESILHIQSHQIIN